MNRMLPLNGRRGRIARSARTAGILAVCSGTLAFLPSFVFHAQGPGFPGPGPGGRGGGFGGVQPDRQVVAQFDKNGDERLDSTERKAAREWLSSQPVFGPGGRGGRFGDPSAPPTAGPKLSPGDVKAHPGSPVYDPATLRTVFLKFDTDDWEQELAAFNNTDVDVPAALTVDGKTFKEPVGVHFRGASSYFMVPEGRKRSLNVSLDFVDGRQHLGGYKTLNLLNANGDPTFLRAVLYTQIASHYIPTPKMNFLRVAINGESWGIYVNAQQFNKDFTRDFFSSTKGARWKVPGSPGGRAGLDYLGERVEDYKRLYEIASKEEPRNWTDLIALTRVLNQTPPDGLEAALAPILDVDGTLKFLALDVALVNSDGYWTRASDYNIYQDEKGRFHILPHDVNEGLGPQEGGGGAAGSRRRTSRAAGRLRAIAAASPACGPADRVPRRAGARPGRARRVRAWRRSRSRSAGGPRRREQGAAREAARGARAPRPVHDLRPRHRRALAGLEDPRPHRRATPRADCRRRQGGHAEAVQLRGVRHRAGRAESVRRGEARVSVESHGAWRADEQVTAPTF